VASGCFLEQSAELEVRLLLGLDGGLERISRRVIGSCVLAAQIARIIALTALATLGLSGASFHEPFQVRNRYV
jgi:hypothetical protein